MQSDQWIGSVSKSALLNFVGRFHGLLGQRKSVIWTAAANTMERAHPRDANEGWALLVEFYKTFKYSRRHVNSAQFSLTPRTADVAPRHAPMPGPNTDAFLFSYEWRKLRMIVLKKHGARCLCCGATAKDGVVIHVDHIKPRRTHPELALTESNLQVLCEPCNHGKGAWDCTDWRDENKPIARPRLVRRMQDGRGDSAGKVGAS